jgi:hypothetical protein
MNGWQEQLISAIYDLKDYAVMHTVQFVSLTKVTGKYNCLLFTPTKFSRG